MKKAFSLSITLLIFLLFFMLPYIFLEAKTEIPGGDVYGIWTYNGSPYLINGEITIPDGETLFIEPGVKVSFNRHEKFNIRGRLLAEGTPDSIIIFTAQTYQIGWHGLRFKDIPVTNDSSKLVYCKVQYGIGQGLTYEDSRGGGIAVESVDKLLVSSCLITQNKTFGGVFSGGGGIMIYNCSPRITNNLITNNFAEGGHGGGILISENANPVVTNNIFFNNTAFGGGALSFINCKPVLINNTLTRNYADHGGALDCVRAAPTFINTIIYGNAASDVGDEVHLELKYEAGFLYCDIEGGFAAFAYNHQQGCPGFKGRYENNIDSVPKFLNIVRDFHLSESSPCIGAGIDAIEVDGTWYLTPLTDFFGGSRPRQVGSSPDLGAIEHDLGDLSENMKSPNLLFKQIYPNPFNNATTIRYILGSETNVNIKIFNPAGQEVKTLLDENQLPGEHKLKWSAEGLPSGVYMYRLKTETSTHTGKCVIQN